MASLDDLKTELRSLADLVGVDYDEDSDGAISIECLSHIISGATSELIRAFGRASRITGSSQPSQPSQPSKPLNLRVLEGNGWYLPSQWNQSYNSGVVPISVARPWDRPTYTASTTTPPVEEDSKTVKTVMLDRDGYAYEQTG